MVTVWSLTPKRGWDFRFAVRSVNVALSALRVADTVGFSIIPKPCARVRVPAGVPSSPTHRTALRDLTTQSADFPLLVVWSLSGH